jgi:hypothetical protein
VKGWELVLSGVTDVLLEQLQPRVRHSTRIADGRYALELTLDCSPERLLTDAIGGGATLVSLNPIRQTLEDFFVQQVTAPDGHVAGGTRPRGLPDATS